MVEPGYLLEVDGRETKGRRANPCLCLRRPKGNGAGRAEDAIAAYLPQFWQNFPTALEADGQRLALDLFADTMAADGSGLQELQPGERKTRSFTIVFADDGAADRAAAAIRPSVTLCHDHLARCALPELGTVDTVDGRLQTLVAEGITGEHDFFAKREAIDEYGWRNFGDLWADHETDGYSGERLFVSHYNNQYDPLFGFLRQYLLQGDARAFELADDLADHVADIDVYHTVLDRAEYNGGLFWHTDHYLHAETATHRASSRLHPENAYDDHERGGGPAGQHCYTTGLLLHYLLTGNESSRAALLSLCDWITRVYEGSGRLTDVLLALRNRKRRDMKNHLTGRYPLDRGTANYLHAIMDRYLLDRAPSALIRLDNIVRHTIHPGDDIGSRQLWRVEDNWYYVVFLQALCRYLHLLDEEGVDDERFLYARDSLLVYADWMLEHEAPYLDNPEILEFPNHTWTAQDLRKANVLFEAAARAPGDGKAYLGRAIQFVDHVAATLREEPTRHYTRIRALLMQNLCPSAALPRAASPGAMRRNYEPLSPVGLTGQAANLLRLTGKALRQLQPGEELRTLRRLLRS